MALINAKLQKGSDGDYWLHVESDGLSAGLNLSAAAGSGLARDAVEAWAEEQLAAGEDPE